MSSAPEWLQRGWPLLVAVLLGALVYRLMLALARRTHRQEARSTLARVVQVIAMPTAVALPLLFLSLAVAVTPLPPEWLGRMRHGLGVGGLLCLVWLLVRAIGGVERGILLRHPTNGDDNLEARRIHTQARVLGRSLQVVVMLVGGALVLMTFPAIRQVGATLLASAGIVGVIAGMAARPVFGNLIAGLQIALAQPIRLDDVVIVEKEWGRIEEIGSTYVVVRIWDDRRMVVPLQWFIEHPFQNWTRTSSQLLGDVMLWLDYRVPMPQLRSELERICASDPRWDHRVCVAQVTETDRACVGVRLLVSARNSGDLFDLRCAVRERMIDFLNAQHPEALPRMRASVVRGAAQPQIDEVRLQAADRVDGAAASRQSSPSPEPPGMTDPASRPH